MNEKARDWQAARANEREEAMDKLRNQQMQYVDSISEMRERIKFRKMRIAGEESYAVLPAALSGLLLHAGTVQTRDALENLHQWLEVHGYEMSFEVPAHEGEWLEFGENAFQIKMDADKYKLVIKKTLWRK